MDILGTLQNPRPTQLPVEHGKFPAVRSLLRFPCEEILLNAISGVCCMNALASSQNPKLKPKP